MQGINKPGTYQNVQIDRHKSCYTISIISASMQISPVLWIQFCRDLLKVESRDSSVRISTGYGLDGQGSIPRRGMGRGIDLSLLHSVKTYSGAQPTSYPMSTGLFPGVKRPGREIDHSPQCSAQVKNDEGI
jgi:hypothetical protein